ncbi:MAG: DinB family protein [Planctomycetota bacterium]
MTDTTEGLVREITRAFAKHVQDDAMKRIAACLARLDEAQVWSRPNPACNAIGNLLLHLEGNVRQWILLTLGGRAGARDRPAEFAARGEPDAPDKDALVAALASTVRDAVAVVESASAAHLLAIHPFQNGKFPGSGVAGVLHVMEHFSGHAYQIYDRTKQLTGQDLRFYDL